MSVQFSQNMWKLWALSGYVSPPPPKKRLSGSKPSHTDGEIWTGRLSGEQSDEPSVFYKALADGGKHKITSKQIILIFNVK